MFCMNCGNNIGDNMSFCPICGYDFLPKATSTCEHCETSNKDDNFAKENFTQLKSDEDTLSKNTSFETPELVFRRKRSSKYLDTIKSFDIAGHNIAQDKIEEIINAIKSEIPEISIDELPIGIVAKCYLGEPYEIHTLSLLGKSIIHHYKKGEALEPDLEKARTLANNKNYAFVEVYKNKLIAVKEDGSTSIIKC